MPRAPRLLAVLVTVTVLLLAAATLRRGGDEAGDPRIYDSPLVTPAPVAPLQNASDSFRFEDARGAYERRAFGPGGELYANLVFTRAGFLRSGDIHACEQLNHLVFGRATLTQLRRGREVVTQLRGSDVARIPPHVPHLYAFLEDSLMTEAWRRPDGTPCEFRAWLYKPFRDRIPPDTALKRFDGARPRHAAA